MRIAFTTLGCKLNYAETATYERGFLAAGWEVVPWTARADVYLVNTCAVTETAEKKSRNLIRRAHKTAPEARIVVTGCYAQLRREALLALPGVWRVFGADEKAQIVPSTLAGAGEAGGHTEIAGHPRLYKQGAGEAGVPESVATLGSIRGRGPLSRAVHDESWEGSRSDDSGTPAFPAPAPADVASVNNAQIADTTAKNGTLSANNAQNTDTTAKTGTLSANNAQIADTTAKTGTLSANNAQNADRAAVFGAYSSGESRTRAFLKVQDGCDNFCAYCTVPFARGRSRNIPICEAVRASEDIAAQGLKEIVLTGVNTGDFGRSNGESFLDLLKALNQVEGIERYRISSIEPNLITPEIVDWIASGTKFQRHFHIPLQSGSDTLLKRVGRRYDTALFASRIDYIRERLETPGSPKVFFGIDVIVGLPGETEEFFEETYRFLRDRIRPAFLHVFPYSRRPGTRAATWPDQVQDSVKTERVARLEALSEELHSAFVAAHKGIRETVLWESSVKNGMMGGYTGNYIRVEKPADPALFNTLESILI